MQNRGGRAGLVAEKAVERILGPRAERLMPRDADFFYGEYPGHRNHLVTALFFDSAGHPAAEVDVEGASAWLAERLHYAQFFTHRIQREVLDLDYPYWVAADIDLSQHVHVHAVTERGWGPVGEVLAQVVAEPVDLTVPPWEMHVVTGIRGAHDLPEKAVGVFLKVHHCAADGMAMRELTYRIFSDEVAGEPAEGESMASRAGMAARAVGTLPRNAARFGKGIAVTKAAEKRVQESESSGDLVRSEKVRSTVLNGKASGEIAIDFVILPMDDVGRIRKAVPGCTVNDVLMAVVSGALRESGANDEEFSRSQLVAKVPRSVRSLEAWHSANQLAMMSIPLHNREPDPLVRLRAICESSRKVKQRTDDVNVRRRAARIESTPAILMNAAAWGARVGTQNVAGERRDHTMVSNIPIDSTDRVFCGAPAMEILPNQPPGDGDLLRHYMCFKSRDELTLNVLADKSVLPDVATYCVLIKKSFDDLCSAAARFESSEQRRL